MQTCDKNMRPLRVGDVLKVYHFTGARRKKHYMYKQIVGTRMLGGLNGPKVEYFDVSHLNMGRDDGYTIGMDEGVLHDYEIVQGLDVYPDNWEDREKVKMEEVK